jgi:hypothetical protein
MKRHRLAPLVAAPLYVLLAAACARPDAGPSVASANGGGGGAGAAASPTPQASMDRGEQARQFAECMRGEGVDMPDPEVGEGGKTRMRIGAREGAVDKKTMNAAMEKCRHLLPNGGEPRPLSAEDLERARAHARCMRENGVPDFPDPQPDGGLRIEVPKGDVTAFEAAMEKCRQLMPGGKVATG